MTPSADFSPPRRPIFFPVVIATVFLTIIGMAAGYVLGERHRQNGGDQPNQSQAGQSQPEQPGSEAAGPPSSAPASTGPPCPAEASEMAVKDGRPAQLSQVMKIVTDNGTTVWICQDPTGALYYQSKTGGVNSTLIQGKNGLFLVDVHRDGDQYEAVATQTGNRIYVSRTSLQIRFANDKVQSNDVVSVE